MHDHRTGDGLPPSGRRGIALRAALAGYDAQYSARSIGEQHPIPSGCIQRVEAVVKASRIALEELERVNGLLAYVALQYPEIGPVRDYLKREGADDA
jgi:hypothetical protein